VIELFREAGAEVHELEFPRFRGASPAQMLRILRAARALRSLVRRRGADLVIANTARTAYLSSLALRGTNVPSIWWVRDFEFGRIAFRALAGQAQRFICVSHAVRRFYGGADDPRFVVVHVGTDVRHALTTVSDEEVVRERAHWGFAPTDVVVGFIGRVVEEKGPLDFLQAVYRAHAADARVKGLIVGTGAGEPTNLEPLIRAEAEARPGVLVLAGFQEREALYYRVIDVFVLASRWQEGYATSMVQAMFAQVPVIATNTGGTPELVRDGKTGILVQSQSPEQIADAIASIMRSPERVARMVSNALHEVRGNNTLEVCASRANAVFDEVMGGSLAGAITPAAVEAPD